MQQIKIPPLHLCPNNFCKVLTKELSFLPDLEAHRIHYVPSVEGMEGNPIL